LIQKKNIKYVFIGLCLAGILFTFHRMSWFVLFFLINLIIIKMPKKGLYKIAPIGASTISFVILLLFLIFPNITDVKNSSFVQERLVSDTLKGRMAVYKFILADISKNWIIGYGSNKSDLYYLNMLSISGKDVALGEEGGIHNGFLEILFMRGLIALIAYVMFFVFTFRNFLLLGGTKHFIFYIPLLETVKFSIANLTNSFPIGSVLGLLLALFLGIFMSVYNHNIVETELFLK